MHGSCFYDITTYTNTTKGGPGCTWNILDARQDKTVSTDSLKNHCIHARVGFSIVEQPFTWWQYIDDIFLVWEHGEQALEDFIEKLNTFPYNGQIYLE